jgi:hypothetical protein
VTVPRESVRAEIALLLDLIDEAYEKAAWHGPNLRGALHGVRAAEAAWRPAPGRHNIWELALHAAYWKYAVWRRLTGAEKGQFAVEGSNWFPRPESSRPDEKAWRADLAVLTREHRRLRETVKSFAPERLHAREKGSQNTNRRLIYGIAAHDLYHTGQIQILKRLAAGRK